MKQARFRRCIALSALFVVGVTGCAAKMTALSGPARTEAPASVVQIPVDHHDAVPSGASGMTIHIDPQTGRILEQPAGGTAPFELTPELQKAVSTSHDGFVAVPSPIQGGGIIINLQGRFQNPLVATIDADGTLKMQHLHELTESGNQ